MMTAENQPQQQPQTADYALEDLANQLRAALMEKAVLKGQLITERRGTAEVIQENQALREKLAKLESKPDPVDTAEPLPEATAEPEEAAKPLPEAAADSVQPPADQPKRKR